MPSEEHGYRMRARLLRATARSGFFAKVLTNFATPDQRGSFCPNPRGARTAGGVLKSAKVVSCELVENAVADARAVLLETDTPEGIPTQIDPIEASQAFCFPIIRAPPDGVVRFPYVTDRVAVSGDFAVLNHHVQSFFQGNRYLLPQLVSRVLQQIPDGPVMDLYAGVGLFAVSLAVQNRRNIVAVEGERSSARDLESNAAAHGTAIRVEQMSGRELPERT